MPIPPAFSPPGQSNPPWYPGSTGGGSSGGPHPDFIVGGVRYVWDAKKGAYVAQGGSNTTTTNTSSSGGGGGSSGGGGGGPLFTTKAGRKISQAQFDALKISYRQLGDIFGFNITDAMARSLAQNDVGTTELQFRLTVANYLQTNKTVLRDYGNYLTSIGKKNDLTTEKGQLSYVLGQAPADFYRTWNNIATTATLQEAGVTVGGQPAANEKPTEYQDLTLTGKEVKGFENILGLSAANPADFQQLGQFASQYAYLALTEMPETRFQSAGLTHTDLAHIIDQSASAQVQDKFNRLVQTHQDFFTRQRAGVGTVSTPGGGTAPAGTLAGISG